jgi:glycine cleavage system H protein
VSNIPDDLKYTEEHLWLRVENGNGRIGITDYAQQQLGDLVFLELPDEGAEFNKGDKFGALESVKSVVDLFCPVSLKVDSVNNPAMEAPQTISEDPYGEGWLISIEIREKTDVDALLGPGEYKSHIGE